MASVKEAKQLSVPKAGESGGQGEVWGIVELPLGPELLLIGQSGPAQGRRCHCLGWAEIVQQINDCLKSQGKGRTTK